MNPDITSYLASLSEQDRQICLRLMNAIEQYLPQAIGKVWHGSPVPAVNAFLHKVDLRGRAISGLLLYDGRHAAKAMDTLRERVRLAGGACRDVVCISAKELREKNCDVFSFAKAETRLAPVLS